MRPVSSFVLILVFFCVGVAGDGASPIKKNDRVDFRATLAEKSLKPGAQGTLLVSLVPKKGIHVNLIPPISITFDSTSVISDIGKIEIPKSSKPEYLEPTKPIRLSFSLSARAKNGPITLRGTVTYFFCSDAEGWCSKFKQPFEVSLKIVK